MLDVTSVDRNGEGLHTFLHGLRLVGLPLSLRRVDRLFLRHIAVCLLQFDG